MTVPPRILHVDDEPDVLGDVQTYLQGEDISTWGRPVVVSEQSFSNALELLEAQRFDLVVLDVRLGAHGQREIGIEEEAGVLTLEEIRRRRFVPIVFFTALPGGVEELAGPLVRVVEKTRGLASLLDAVRDLFDTRLPAVNRALLRLIEDEQRRYMWDFVSAQWAELEGVGDHTAVAYLLARRLGRSLSGPAIGRLASELGESAPPEIAAGQIHPVEMYVQPVWDDTALQAGDLLRGTLDEESGWWLVLTPSCDLEWDKAEWVLVSTATPLEEHPDLAAWRAAESRGARRSAEGKVQALLGQSTGGQKDRWLYLPAALNVPDLVVDFQRLKSVRRQAARELPRVASLDSPFAEAAVNRFGRYFGRVGTPDLNVSALIARLAATGETPA